MQRKLFWAFAVLTLVTGVSLAADWPAATGGNPQRNGTTTEAGPETADILWQGSLPSQFAQPAVIAGNIAAISRTFNISDPLHGTLIVAHDLVTGDTLWTAELPIDFPATDWRSRVCAIRDGKVYASRNGNSNFSYLYALDAQSGDVLWHSQDSLDESSTESPAFASNGDLVVGGFSFVERVNAEDGSRVWRTSRFSPTSGGSEVALFGNRCYTWEASGQGPRVVSFDVDTGERRYASVAVGGGFIQQVSLFIGLDGTVYAPRSQNNSSTDYLVAFADNGQTLTERWRVPLGFVPFATFGVGPDSSIYSFSREYRVLRIDPANGTVLDSSDVFPSDFYQPRLAVDAAGRVFLTNGGFSQGALFAYNADLTFRWSEDIPNVNIGNPAIGQGGTMLVCGTGTTVIAYRGTTVSASTPPPLIAGVQLQQNFPNPFNAATTLTYVLSERGAVNLSVFNALGEWVTTLVDEVQSPGYHIAHFNADRLASGTYYCRLQSPAMVTTIGMVLVR